MGGLVGVVMITVIVILFVVIVKNKREPSKIKYNGKTISVVCTVT